MKTPTEVVMALTRKSFRNRCLLLAVALALCVGAPSAEGASSRDYPGPCTGETVAPSIPFTPLYLSADYHGVNPSAGIVVMPAPGRIRLGISCVATGFAVVKIGFESALCMVRGLCDLDQLPGLTEEDIVAVAGIPGEVPFFHRCARHGFGWYDATQVAPGTYLAVAQSVSRLGGFVDGHGTADTYAFFGNGGVYQPVNCPVTPPGGGGGGGGGNDGGGGGCGMQSPDGQQMPCLEDLPVN
jgi:hypothetical protein